MPKKIWIIPLGLLAAVNLYGAYVSHQLNKSKAEFEATQARTKAAQGEFGKEYVQRHREMVSTYQATNDYIDSVAKRFLNPK